MKKILSVFCALITTLSLAACSGSTGSESDPSNSSGSSSGTSESSGESSSDTSNAPDGDKLTFNVNNLPRMDGSTSAAPLEIGLKSGFLGIPYEDAKELYLTPPLTIRSSGL